MTFEEKQEQIYRLNCCGECKQKLTSVDFVEIGLDKKQLKEIVCPACNEDNKEYVVRFIKTFYGKKKEKQIQIICCNECDNLKEVSRPTIDQVVGQKVKDDEYEALVKIVEETNDKVILFCDKCYAKKEIGLDVFAYGLTMENDAQQFNNKHVW